MEVEGIERNDDVIMETPRKGSDSDIVVILFEDALRANIL